MRYNTHFGVKSNNRNLWYLWYFSGISIVWVGSKMTPAIGIIHWKGSVFFKYHVHAMVGGQEWVCFLSLRLQRHIPKWFTTSKIYSLNRNSFGYPTKTPLILTFSPFDLFCQDCRHFFGRPQEIVPERDHVKEGEGRSSRDIMCGVENWFRSHLPWDETHHFSLTTIWVGICLCYPTNQRPANLRTPVSGYPVVNNGPWNLMGCYIENLTGLLLFPKDHWTLQWKGEWPWFY